MSSAKADAKNDEVVAAAGNEVSKSNESAEETGYNRYDWAKLIFCYFIFYSCLTCWMALHISVMVSVLPDRTSWCNTQPNYNGLSFCMGEPRYSRYLDEMAVTYANSEDVKDGVPLNEPWSKNGAPLEGVSNFGSRNYAFQQIRVLNNYNLRTMVNPGYGQQVKCELTHAADRGKIIFFGFQDPFLMKTAPANGLPNDVNSFFSGANTWSSSNGNYFLNTTTGFSGSRVEFPGGSTTATSGSIPINTGTSFTAVWTTGAQAPHIIQFMATLNTNAACAGETNRAYDVSCTLLGPESGTTDSKWAAPENSFSVSISQAGSVSVPC
jgi:hypothetical protein